MVKNFKVLGDSITYKEALKIKLPKGYELVELADVREIINNADELGIRRGEYYFFKQIERRREKDYPLSVLWLGGLYDYSDINGLIRCLLYRARGVLIKKRFYQRDHDVRMLIKYGVLVKSKTSKGFLHLSDKFIQRRTRAMIKLSEKNEFNLNTFKGFKEWIHAANCLTILSVFKKGLRDDILDRYSEVISIFDEPMVKAAKIQMYGVKK